MNRQEQTTFIIQKLGDAADPNDVIYELCQTSNLTWPQAEALMKSVQAENEGKIARKKFPLLFALAFAIFLGGIGLVGYSIYLFVFELSSQQGAVRHAPPVDAATIFLVIIQVVIETHGAVLYALLTGLAMIFGSLLGLRDAWAAILNW